MLGASKILTVSYGTFSCTLEGFDDAFGTMKAIAEYFRDLAAEDRYFGATPPTPDADMLQRIAEKEIRRRVEAHVQKNGVVLRQLPQDAQGATAVGIAPAVAIADVPGDAVEAAPETALAAIAAANAGGDSAAAKLARIRAIVARNRADAAESLTEAAPPEPATVPEAAGIAEVPTRIEVPAEVADAVPVQPPAPPIVTEAPAKEDFADDPDDGDDEDSDGETAALRAVAERARGDAPAPTAPTPLSASATDSDDDGDDELADRVAATLAGDAAALPLQPAAPMPRVLVVNRAAYEQDPDAAVASALARLRTRTVATVAPLHETPPAPQDPAVELRAMLDGSGLSPEDEADLIGKLAAVGDDEPAPQADRPAAARAPDLGDEDDTLAASAPPARHVRPGRAALDGQDPTDDAAVSRLVATANSRLQGEENRRRLSAIAHLKAAVAATVADRKLGGARTEPAQESASELDRYRDDLSRLVRPQRPATSEDEPRTSRPVERLAPLVLVSTQRVDAAAIPVQPVRPRRIQVATLSTGLALHDEDEDEDDDLPDAPEPATTFAAFAEHAGAEDLADLLEAAAAYIALHEGRDSFSRPQVLRKVEQIATEEGYDREAGLRTFGALLREGRFQKVRRGQFRMTRDPRLSRAG